MKALTLLVLSWALSGSVAAASLSETINKLGRKGQDMPDEALQALAQLPASDPYELFLLSVTQAQIYAAHGREQEARSRANLLHQANPDLHGSTGHAAADMVLAELALAQAKPGLASQLAKSGLDTLEQSCAQKAAACDERVKWELLMQAYVAAFDRGLMDESQRLAKAALDSANASQDPYRQAVALLAVSRLAIDAGQLKQAERLLRQARSVADQTKEVDILVRVLRRTALLRQAQGDDAGERLALRQALAAVQAAGLPTQSVRVLLDLSDLELRAQRPAKAIEALEQAQQGLTRVADRALKSTHKHNMGLALLAQGQIEAGKRHVEAGLAMWEDSGAREEQVVALREYGEALARAGDTAGALAVYHRERKIRNDALEADRNDALRASKIRFNQDKQQRAIELQSRENTLQAALLDNHLARKKLWVWLALVALLFAALLILPLRRMLKTQGLLRRRQNDLRVQSDQDSLTGLPNRRCLSRSISAAQGATGEYRGGVLLIDLDHFKRINDKHGHAAGDLVLQEVARRLSALVGPNDVACRWGGEEFAIHLASATPERSAEVAKAVLFAIGAHPFFLPTTTLQVSASVGFASFPLPQLVPPIPWEQALNLADMALYLTKNHGRNQAFGLMAAQADTQQALAAIEADFDGARRLGKVQLQAIAGPAMHNPEHASSPPAPRPAESDSPVRTELAALPSQRPEPDHHRAESSQSSGA